MTRYGLAATAAMFCMCLAGCGRETPENTADVKKEEKISGSSNWHIFRGDPGLTGKVEGDLPDGIIPAWSFRTAERITSSPVVDGETVFIGSEDGFVYAIDLMTGKEKWKFDTASPVEAPPLYSHGAVFASNIEGTIYSIDSSEGKAIWRYKTGGRIVGSANLLESGGQKYIVVGSHDNFLYCLDMKTGEKKWEYRTESFINGTPAVHGEKIIFGGCDGFCHVVSAPDSIQAVSIPAGSYVAGSAAVFPPYAVFGSFAGEIVCMDLDSMEEKWRFSEEDTGAFMSSPAIIKGRVIAGSQNRKLYCLDLLSGEKIWEHRALKGIESSPIADETSVIYVSTDGWMYCLRMSDGSEEWKYEIGPGVKSSPAFWGRGIVIGAEDGSVYAFSKAKETQKK